MRLVMSAMAALSLALLPGTRAGANDEIGLSGLNTMRAGWGTILDNQNRPMDRLYREDVLDLDLSWRTLRLNMAAAAVHPAELPDARPEAARIRDVDLIRRSLEWDGPAHVQVGHFWTTFGNGLALSLYRDDALENPRLTGTQREEMPTTWDNRGDGVLVEVQRGDWAVKALTGGHDYAGSLAAANVEWNRPWGNLGGSWVRASEIPDNIQNLVPHVLDLESRELYATAKLGNAELSINHVDQVKRPTRDYAPLHPGAGLATYASMVVPVAGWSALAEYKYYRFADRTLYINNPPIVQKEIPTRLIARKRRLINFEDETGLQLDLSRPLGEGGTLLLSGAWASRIDDNLLPSFDEALSAYQEYTAGWLKEFSLERHLTLGVAYAEETNGWAGDGNAVANRSWYRRTGLTASVLTPVPLLRSVELAGEFMHKVDREWDQSSDAVLMWADIYPSTFWSLNLTADYEEHSDSRQDWMASGEVRADFHLWSVSHTVTAFAGRLRGGLVCSSGNCRVVAPFDGIKLSLASRF